MHVLAREPHLGTTLQPLIGVPLNFEVMKDPEVQNLLTQEGAVPQVSPSPEEFKKFVDSEITRWGELVAKAGILHSQ